MTPGRLRLYEKSQLPDQRRAFGLGGFALLPFVPVAASAEPVDAAWLARINQELKAIPPLSGRFQQKLPNGGHAEF